MNNFFIPIDCGNEMRCAINLNTIEYIHPVNTGSRNSLNFKIEFLPISNSAITIGYTTIESRDADYNRLIALLKDSSIEIDTIVPEF